MEAFHVMCDKNANCRNKILGEIHFCSTVLLLMHLPAGLFFRITETFGEGLFLLLRQNTML